MLYKLLSSIIHAITGDRGKVCPKCKSIETEDYGSFWRCYRCDYEW